MYPIENGISTWRPNFHLRLGRSTHFGRKESSKNGHSVITTFTAHVLSLSSIVGGACFNLMNIHELCPASVTLITRETQWPKNVLRKHAWGGPQARALWTTYGARRTCGPFMATSGPPDQFRPRTIHCVTEQWNTVCHMSIAK